MTHLVGSAKNQIPTNQELGDLAFQDGNVKTLGIGNLTASDVQINTSMTSIKPTLVLDFANQSKSSDYIDPRILYTPSTGGTWNGRDSYAPKVRSTASTPRYEFVGSEPQGLFCESVGTNYLNYSQAFGSWSTGSSSVTTGQLAPDGSTSAATVTDSSNASGGLIYQSTAVIPAVGEVWCISAYIKKDNDETRFPCFRFYNSSARDFRIHFSTKTGQSVTGVGTNATIVNSGVIDCGNWWRVWVSGTFTTAATYGRFYLYPAASATLANSIVSTPIGSVTMWGAQAEKGSYPTSYIPVPSTTAVSRTIDNYVITDISSFFNPVEGTIVTEFISKASLSATVVSFEGSGFADANSIRIRVGSAGGLLGQIRYSTTDVNFINNAYTASTNYKVAYAYKQGDCGMCVNGGTVVTQAAAYIPTVSYMMIGCEYSSGSPIYALDGTIKKITYYPKRLTNAELVELTK